MPPKKTGRAINLVSVDSAGKMVVSEEAAECLGNIKEQVSVVSVLGRFRGGKSSLLARLIGRKSFEVSHSVQACTKGIRLYDPPLGISGGKKLILLDTEGLMATDSDTTHDTRVFALGILLSSAFVYNVTGTIDETTLSTLRVVTQFASMMMGDGDNPAKYEDLAKEMPEFCMLVRDFALKLENSDGKPISSTQWLEEALSTDEVASRSSQLENFNDKIEIRKTIKKLFPTRTCYTLPRPTANEEVLAHMDTADDKDLKPEFVQGIKKMRKALIQEAPPKRVLGEAVTGKGLLAMTRQLVDRINSGTTPKIRDSWVLLAELRARDAAERAMRHMCKVTASWGEQEMSIGDLRRALEKVGQQTLNMYIEASPEDIAVEVREKLEREDIPGRSQEVLEAATRRVVEKMKSDIRVASEQIEALLILVPRSLSGDEQCLPIDELWKAINEKITGCIATVETTAADMQQEDADRWRISTHEAMRPMLATLVEGLVDHILEGGGNAEVRQEIQNLEALLHEAHRLQENAEKNAQAATEALRRQSEETEERINETRKSFSADVEELTMKLQRANEENTTTIKQASLLQSELETSRKDHEATQTQLRLLQSDREMAENAKYLEDDLRSKLSHTEARAVQAEKNVADLKEELSNSTSTLHAALDTAREHADAVIASVKQTAEQKITEVEKLKREAEETMQRDKRVMDKTKLEHQQTVTNLTVRCETLREELSKKSEALAECHNLERETAQKHRQEIDALHKRYQTDMDKRQSEWARASISHSEEKGVLEKRLAVADGVNENGKRELERLKEVENENKKLRSTIETSNTEAEFRNKLEEQSQLREKELDETKKQLIDERQKFAHLALERYHSDLRHKKSVLN